MTWGETDLNLNTGVAEDLQSHLKHASPARASGGTLAANRSAAASREGDDGVTHEGSSNIACLIRCVDRLALQVSAASPISLTSLSLKNATLWRISSQRPCLRCCHRTDRTCCAPRLKIQDHSRRHSSGAAIPLSTPGSKRWMSMVMADDEDSDFVANDAEQQ
jgi:hypothetical protein